MPSIMRRHPGYFSMAVAVLAISIGLNLVVFTVVNALWIRSLPFAEPKRVVTIPRVTFSGIENDLVRVFEGGVAGQVLTSAPHEDSRASIHLPGVSSIEALGVTSGYFSVLGLKIRGRDFAPEDERDGAEPVAIVSDRLWTNALGRRAAVIGGVAGTKPIPIRIIGVAPPGFQGARRGERADIWIPPGLVRRLAFPTTPGRTLSMMVIGRLGPEQTATSAQRQLEALTPNVIQDFLTAVVPITEVFGTPEAPTFVIREGHSLLVVSGLAALVLLGGCATIAALVLMHYERRRTELAVRMALGAGRLRLTADLWGELLWVAAAGVAAGLLLTVLCVRVVPALRLPGGVDIGRLDLSIDWRVIAVGLTATIVTLVIASASPILRSTRLPLAGELVAGPAAVTLGSLRVRQLLLGLQVCTAVIVLISAGLFVRAVLHGFTDAPGFDARKLVFVSVQEPLSGTRQPGSDPTPLIIERTNRLMPVLRDVSGVREVAEGLPPIGPHALTRLSDSRIVRFADRQLQLRVGVLQGSPNLLSALGVRAIAGRALTVADFDAPAPRPAVITRSLAELLRPGGAVLGETLSLPQLRGGPYLVVGIAGDMAFGSLLRPAVGVVITAGPGDSATTASFVVRTDRPTSVAEGVRRAVQADVVRVVTGDDAVAREIGSQRLGAWFFSGFGLAALLLGVGGTFGLVAYLAESQRREFGLRMALGADLRHVVRHAVAAGLKPVLGGIAVGVFLGGLISRVFEAFLVGIDALDALTYLTVVATILSCATIAALTGAWRIRRTNPTEVFRAA